MRTFTYVAVTFLILLLTTIVSVCSMIYGWGLEPENWVIIIGAFICIFALGALQGMMANLYD